MDEKTQEFKRVCAWCGKSMGILLAEPNGLDANTTHGMCDACMDEHAPKPFIDEALVMQAQMMAGRNVHSLNQTLQGYISAVEVYDLSKALEARLQYRKIWSEQLKRLKEIVSAEKCRRGKQAIARS